MRISIESEYVLRERNSERDDRGVPPRWARLTSVAATIALLAVTACGSSDEGGAPIIDRNSGDGSSSGTTGEHDASTTGVSGDALANGEDGATEDATTQGDASEAADTSTSPGEDGATAHDAGGTVADASMPDANKPETGAAPDAGHVADAGTGGNDASTTSTCVSTLPAGWSLVAYNTAIDSCPTGYSETIVSGTPVIAPGACTCSCTVTQTGSCGSGSLAMLTNPGHGNDTCVMQWFTATVNGSQCIAVPAAQQGNLGNFQASPLPASGAGGACTSTAHATTGAVTEPTQRYCAVPTASADAVCNGNPPAGFSACIISAGAKACPATTPFIHPFTVETSAALACGTCTACTASTTCGTPTLSAFTNANCTPPAALSFPVNGACQANPAEQPVLAIQYSANATGSCVAGASAASVTLTGEQTICCR
jgi:hypothetical protein